MRFLSVGLALLPVDGDLVAEELLLLVVDGSTEGADLLVVHHEAQTVLGNLLFRAVDGDDLLLSQRKEENKTNL